MSDNLRRFFYYWRFPIYCLVLGIIFLALGITFKGNAGTVFGVLWLFDCLAFLYAFVMSIIKVVKGIIYYFNYGEKYDDIEFPEIEFFVNAFEWISDDISTFMELPGSYKLKCVGFRVLGTILIIAGSIGCFFFSFIPFLLVSFTLVIIGGGTLWVISNPNKYNEQVQGVRMVVGKKGLTDEILYKYLSTMETSLGTPAMAEVLGYKQKVITYGSNYDHYVYVVYKAKRSRTFYISTVSSMLVQTILPVKADLDPYHSTSTVQDYGYYLDELTEVVESAVERAYVY